MTFAQKATALAATSLCLATLAAADGHSKDPSIAARQAHMQLYQHNIAILGNMAQGKTDYDAEAAQRAANNLAAVAGLDETSYWADPATAEGSRAEPAIWDNLEDFAAKQQMMRDAAAQMVDAAGTDLAGLQGAMGDLGGACSGCHRPYRARN